MSAWPFKEAQILQKRLRDQADGVVAFETGFGPSGLPHIGTFAEVARTTWVRRAFEQLTGMSTRLITFSDDMDGLRKVPLNMPNKEMLAEHLGMPLCRIPDPYGEHESYSGYMNAKLNAFLNLYGFDYDFQSSYEAYSRGDFNEGLSIILEKHEEVKAIILPTLQPETREKWSPFFPICERCGRVYTTRVVDYHPADHAVAYVCDSDLEGARSCGFKGTTSVHDGKVKVGWKVDWALRWYAYHIKYEMYGKDLIESARLSSKIIRTMGKQPPCGFSYELFLDEDGKKISKSVGKGLAVDSWVKYAPIESLLYYLFQNPRRAKRLYWEVVPRSVDDYLGALSAYQDLPEEERMNNPLWHIFEDKKRIPNFHSSITFSLLDNLISSLDTADEALVLGFVERYDPKAAADETVLRDLIHKSRRFYEDYILPQKHYRRPDEREKSAFRQMRSRLAAFEGDDERELQGIPFAVAKEAGIEPADLFHAFYEVYMGQERGPRFGTLARLLGWEKMLEILDAKL